MQQLSNQQQLGQQLPLPIRWHNRTIPGMAHSQGCTMRLGSEEPLSQVSCLKH
jgi:hypothetical protein